MNIYDDIKEERDAQNKQWGGPVHDDSHDVSDWFLFITKQVGCAINSEHDKRTRLVKIAALAIAGIESMDRKSKL